MNNEHELLCKPAEDNSSNKRDELLSKPAEEK